MPYCILWRIWIPPYTYYSPHVHIGLSWWQSTKTFENCWSLIRRLIRIESRSIATLCVSCAAKVTLLKQLATSVNCDALSYHACRHNSIWGVMEITPEAKSVSCSRVSPSYSKMITITSHDDMTWSHVMTWHDILMKTGERYLLYLTALRNWSTRKLNGWRVT